MNRLLLIFGVVKKYSKTGNCQTIRHFHSDVLVLELFSVKVLFFLCFLWYHTDRKHINKD